MTAYYSSWSIYHSTYPLYAKDIPISLLNTVIYAFIEVDAIGNLFLPHDEEELTNLRDFLSLKTRVPNNPPTLLFSVGGWGKNSESFAKFSSYSGGRKYFAQQVVAFCHENHVDGIDIDWEFPKNKQEGKYFALLLKEVYKACKSATPPLQVTAALASHPSHYNKISWNSLSSFLDRAHIMTYTFHGPWHDPENEETNHQSALEATKVGSALLNIRAAMHFYEGYFPKEKLFVGVPLFFTTYAGASHGELPSHYASPYSGPGNNLSDPDAPGELLYKEVMHDLKQKNALGFWDTDARAFSVYYDDSKTFGSGMNDESLEEIQKYIKEAGYGGTFVWELRGDTYDWHALHLLSPKT